MKTWLVKIDGIKPYEQDIPGSPEVGSQINIKGEDYHCSEFRVYDPRSFLYGEVHFKKGLPPEIISEDPKGHAGSLKAPLHLLPPTALEEISWALKHGADKYGRANWRDNKVCATTYVGAMLRHLGAWQDGEDIDALPGSGRSHLASVAACVCILLDAEKCGTLVDDRSKLPIHKTP